MTGGWLESALINADGARDLRSQIQSHDPMTLADFSLLTNGSGNIPSVPGFPGAAKPRLNPGPSLATWLDARQLRH